MNLRTALPICFAFFVVAGCTNTGDERSEQINSDVPVTAPEVLDKYLSVLGGEQEIQDSLTTFTVMGISTPFEDDSRPAPAPGWAQAHWPTVSFQIQFKNVDLCLHHSKQEWKHNGKSKDVSVGAFKGQMWRLSSDRVSLAPLPDGVMIDMMERHGNPKSALLLKEFSGTMEIQPDSNNEKNNLICIRFTSENGSEVDRYFDKETGLMHKRCWKREREKNSTLFHEAIYEYRQQGKFRTLKSISHKLNGQPHKEIVFDIAEINKEIDDSTFAIPDAVSNSVGK